MSQLHSPLGESQQVDYKLVFCVLFLHHLIRKHLPAFQSDAHGVGASGQAVHFQALQAISLYAHQLPLKVVQLNLRGRYVGRVLQMELVLDGVGVEHIGADDDALFFQTVVVVVDQKGKHLRSRCLEPYDTNATIT